MNSTTSSTSSSSSSTSFHAAGGFEAAHFVGLDDGVARVFGIVYVSLFCVVLPCVCNSSLTFLLYSRYRTAGSKAPRRRCQPYLGSTICIAAANATFSLINGGSLLANLAATRWRHSSWLCTAHAASIEIEAVLTAIVVMYACLDRVHGVLRSRSLAAHSRRRRLLTRLSLAALVVVPAVAEFLVASLKPASTTTSSAALPLPGFYVCSFADSWLQYLVIVVCIGVPYLLALLASSYTRCRPSDSPCPLTSADTCCLLVAASLPVTQSPFLIGQRLAAYRLSPVLSSPSISTGASSSLSSSMTSAVNRGLNVMDHPLAWLTSVTTLLRFSQPLVLPLLATVLWFKGRSHNRRLLPRLRLNPSTNGSATCSLGSPLTPATPMTLYADAGGLQLLNHADQCRLHSATYSCDTPSTAPTISTTATTLASITPHQDTGLETVAGHDDQPVNQRSRDRDGDGDGSQTAPANGKTTRSRRRCSKSRKSVEDRPSLCYSHSTIVHPPNPAPAPGPDPATASTASTTSAAAEGETVGPVHQATRRRRKKSAGFLSKLRCSISASSSSSPTTATSCKQDSVAMDTSTPRILASNPLEPPGSDNELETECSAGSLKPCTTSPITDTRGAGGDNCQVRAEAEEVEDVIEGGDIGTSHGSVAVETRQRIDDADDHDEAPIGDGHLRANLSADKEKEEEKGEEEKEKEEEEENKPFPVRRTDDVRRTSLETPPVAKPRTSRMSPIATEPPSTNQTATSNPRKKKKRKKRVKNG